MGGTGLSGTTGMRMFGYAADQVVQVEMVLPTGGHVRFSPTEWVNGDQLAWPRTTKVTGWCNSNPVEDETEWEWEVCPQGGVNFDDLWHAVRGGGNGWGVITSLEYQLPDYPGQLVPAAVFLGNSPDDIVLLSSSLQDAVQEVWINFLIDSQWNPSAVHMAEEESNLCGGPDGGSSFPNVFGTHALIFCHRNGGRVYSDTWVRSVEAHRDIFLAAGATNVTMVIIAQYIKPGILGEFQDYAELLLASGDSHGVPKGKLPDNPRPATDYSFFQDSLMVPIKFLVENRDVSVPWLTSIGKSGTASGNYMM
eukprot:13074109-Ditylum_brightwellii.AAC.1